MHFTNHFESSISERKPTAVEWYEPEADGFGPSGASRSGARPENTQKRRRDKRALPLAAWEWDRRDATGGAEAPYLLPSIDRTPGSALRLSSLGRGPRRPARRRRSARTSPWLRVPLHRTCGEPGRAAPPWQNSQMPPTFTCADMAGACECG